MKKGWSTRLLSAVLALVLVFQLLPPRAWQAEAAGAEGAMGEDAILPEDLAAMNEAFPHVRRQFHRCGLRHSRPL